MNRYLKELPTTMRFQLIVCFVVFSFFIACAPTPSEQHLMGAGGNWSHYLGDKGSSQYSHLTQISQENVNQLETAWTYTLEGADPQGRSQIQCNPLVINGVLYGSSAQLHFFALDASTGKEIWRFDPFKGEKSVGGLGVNRGLMFWESGEDKRILCTAGAFLYALNAGNGELISTFGEGGKVSLHEGLGAEAQDLVVLSNTPGVIYRDFLIMGMRVSEGLPAAPGHIRAFNVRTGTLEWIFHTIPKPGEFGYDTWPEEAHTYIGGANSWAGMSLDEERGIVYVPTGSAASDFYGGNRKGENLFANCLIALDAETGERKWHYQTVHHDIWDRDLPAPPNLLTVTHKGKKIDAVAQITKSGFVFLFDRVTGEPLFPIEERPVPNSLLKGESAWATQPIPVKPPPFARQFFTSDSASNLSEAGYQKIVETIGKVRTGKQFIPPSEEGTMIFPGFDGGGEWGGAAVDPSTNWMYVNANEMPWILTMFELLPEESDNPVLSGRNTYVKYCASCHGTDRKGGSYMGEIPSLVEVKTRLSSEQIVQTIQKGKGVMPAFSWMEEEQVENISQFLFASQKELIELPKQSSAGEIGRDVIYGHTGYNRFKDDEGYPAIKPPWGTLNAIDLDKGELVWKIPLGEFPELTERGISPTGTENYGGPVVTAGGIIFIAATLDEKFRAFDKENGNLLWETQLPAGGYATPSTYEIDGKQFVVIACGGGKMGTPSGDTYVAFALPE